MIPTPSDVIRELLHLLCGDSPGLEAIKEKSSELVSLQLLSQNTFRGFSSSTIGLGCLLGSLEMFCQAELFRGIILIIEDSKIDFNMEQAI